MQALLVFFNTFWLVFKSLWSFYFSPEQTLKDLCAYSPYVIYGFVASIILLETGVLFMAFLPGDCLLLLLGSLAAEGYFSIHKMAFLLAAAGTLGSALNYVLGRRFGPTLLAAAGQKSWLQPALVKARNFFNRHGETALLFCKMFGWLRTFVPFLAAIHAMPFASFILQSALGSFLWIYGFTYTGYGLARFEIVQSTRHYWGFLSITFPLLFLITKYLIQKVFRKQNNRTEFIHTGYNASINPLEKYADVEVAAIEEFKFKK